MTPKSEQSSTAAHHETIVETPSALELVITRTFDAPRVLVWSTFTDAKHLPNWQPTGATMPVCEIDLRAGGTWHYVYRNASGREMSVTGKYREVVPPQRFVQVMQVGDEENTTTTTFSEESGRTTVTVAHVYASEASRDRALQYVQFGVVSSYTRLDGYLASQS